MERELIGRKKNIDLLDALTHTKFVDHKAFFGLKGVGKTTLFMSYFTSVRVSELAQNFKNIYIYTQLDSKKSGEDLYQFLIGQVKKGIRRIPNREDVESIKSEMKDIDDFYEKPNDRLAEYLSYIRDLEYDVILIMDHFHCMERDTKIADSQYDVLRSLAEEDLLTYWIISDTDLAETCATEQYLSSFFAQKFSSSETIKPISQDDAAELVRYISEIKCKDINEKDCEQIARLTEGVPRLISIAIDRMDVLKADRTDIDDNILLSDLVSNENGKSLLTDWSVGLSKSQLTTIYNLAVIEKGYITESEIEVNTDHMNKLSDNIGRGILHVESVDGLKRWSIAVKLYKEYLSRWSVEEFINSVNVQHNNIDSALNIPNNVTIMGDLIVNKTDIAQQTNIAQLTNNVTVYNVDNVVGSLEDLQKLICNNEAYLPERVVSDKLGELPFKQVNLWEEMPEEKQSEEIEKYADGIFASDVFTRGELTSDQMERFHINEQLLTSLAPDCRAQIICGIQVYDLIQICIEKFGFSMSESESPRGILFGRAFEKMLKDKAYPALCSLDQFRTKKLGNGKSLEETDVNKTTIGNFTFLMQSGKAKQGLANVSEKNKIISHCDYNWWNQYNYLLNKTGKLRNECCHSGLMFGKEELDQMMDYIFKQELLSKTLVFDSLRQKH